MDLCVDLGVHIVGSMCRRMLWKVLCCGLRRPDVELAVDIGGSCAARTGI